LLCERANAVCDCRFALNFLRRFRTKRSRLFTNKFPPTAQQSREGFGSLPPRIVHEPTGQVIPELIHEASKLSRLAQGGRAGSHWNAQGLFPFPASLLTCASQRTYVRNPASGRTLDPDPSAALGSDCRHGRHAAGGAGIKGYSTDISSLGQRLVPMLTGMRARP
jgi:hypothetical protein